MYNTAKSMILKKKKKKRRKEEEKRNLSKNANVTKRKTQQSSTGKSMILYLIFVNT